MTLEDLFLSLAQGELSNLSLADDSGGGLTISGQRRVTNYANQALLRLYSRFVLKEKDLVLQMHEEITFYHLVPRFARNFIPPSPEEDEPIRYILDLPEEPFLGDIIKVLVAYDAKGRRLPLNDDAHPHSLFTPQANLLQVPRPHDHDGISLIYQAKHRKLTGAPDEEIALPEVLLEAFNAYIAYKVFSHMNTQESTAKAQEHLMLYEALCVEAETKDLVNTSISTSNTRFHARGWI